MALPTNLWNSNPGLGKFNRLDCLDDETGNLRLQLSVQKGVGKWLGELKVPVPLADLRYSLSKGWAETKVPSQPGIFIFIRTAQIVFSPYTLRWDVWHREDGTAPDITYTVHDTFALLSSDFTLGNSSFREEKVQLKMYG